MTSLRIAFLVLGFVLLADAASAKPIAPPAAGTFGTRDQLRECLALDDSLKQRTLGIQAAMVASNQKFDADETEAGKLGEMRKSLDRNDKAAISAFNQLAQDHNLHVQQTHQQQADAELADGILLTDKAAAEQKCGSLTYRPADIDVVTKERKKAAAVAAGASAP